MKALEWWEETTSDWGYTGVTLRCGHGSLVFCSCWCDGYKSEEKRHTKDECTHDNCVYMECPSCSMPKNPNSDYCEVCAEEEFE